jgi:dipeptidyl aminopeptidase/acylaminoacyl peptidase
VNRETEKRHANLWVVPTEGGRPRQFTYGDHVDNQPRWSPDGTRIVFLSTRADEEQAQLYVIPFGGGEARPLTNLKGTFGNFEWSPDSGKLVVQFRKNDPEDVERQKDDATKKRGVVCRHITRVFYKLDETGYLPKERWHLWTLDVRSGKATPLTKGDTYDEVEPSWSPDGAEVVFCSNRSEDPDLDPDAIDLFVIRQTGGPMERLETPFGRKMLPRFSPDGRRIAYIGAEGRGAWWKNDNLWVVSRQGPGDTQNVTGHLDIHVSSFTLTDMVQPVMAPPRWSADGSTVYVQVCRHGATPIYAVSLEDGNASTVTGEQGLVADFSADTTTSVIAYLFADWTDPGQVWVHRRSDGRTRKLTRFNQALLREIDLGEIEEVWFQGPTKNNVHGWILTPPGFDPSKCYPSILQIHGGPLVQYGTVFMHEFYFLAAQGYVVYFCNPRGGQGYGENHAKAIWNAWGTADYEDIMAWVDYVGQKPYIDRTKLGVTGGSYGGFMTNWIIGHTDRFKAAVTQRCVSNQISAWGSSDVNWVFEQAVGGDRAPWDNMEQYWNQSPMKHIGAATTPTLVLHSERDLRCAQEQGEQVYVALKKRGIATELILFPDEPHGLSRVGRTDRRIARLHHIRRWFDRYLKNDDLSQADELETGRA